MGYYFYLSLWLLKFEVKSIYLPSMPSMPSTYRLQIFLARDQYLQSLLPHGDQAIAGHIEKHVLKPMLASLTTCMETRLKIFKLFSREE